MSSIKQAAAIVLQRRYREHLDRRAAGILVEIDTRMHEFRRLPTTRLDGAAATVGLHMSVADLSAIIGESFQPRVRIWVHLLTPAWRGRASRMDVAGAVTESRGNAVCTDVWHAARGWRAAAYDHGGAGQRACAC